LQQAVIKEIHEGFTGHHIGRDKTFDHVRSRFFWKGMTTDVYDYISKCVTCNTQNLKVESSPLQDTPIARYPFQRISVDTTGKYPTTANENKFCLTVTDQFSGWVELFPISNQSTVTICDVLLKQVFNRYGFPRYMISDNGTPFISEILRQITKLGHIHHIKTSIYHPRSNAMGERPHKIIHEMLAKLGARDNWDEYLPSIQSALNFSKSSSRDESPYFLLFHRDPLIPIDTILAPKEQFETEEFLPRALNRLRTSYKTVRRHLKANQERNHQYVDKKSHAKAREVQVGDLVYMFNFTKRDKFDKRWLPNYRVISQRGPVSFTVQNQVTGKTHRVHADALRVAKGLQSWDEEIDSSTEEEDTMTPNEDTLPLDSEEESTDGESESSEEDTGNVGPSARQNAARQAKATAKLRIKYCKSIGQEDISLDKKLSHKLCDIFNKIARELKS
jgi:transposase InsO family protein